MRRRSATGSRGSLTAAIVPCASAGQPGLDQLAHVVARQLGHEPDLARTFVGRRSVATWSASSRSATGSAATT